MTRRLAGGAAWWITLVALYMLLVGKNEAAEWIAGGIAAAFGTAAIAVVSSSRAVRFAPQIGWVNLIGRLPGQVYKDCAVVIAQLGPMLRGQPACDRFRTVPFDASAQDEVTAARRALVILGASVGPNTDVISIDQKQRLMLVHQLAPSPEPPGKGDREWPL